MWHVWKDIWKHGRRTHHDKFAHKLTDTLHGEQYPLGGGRHPVNMDLEIRHLMPQIIQLGSNTLVAKQLGDDSMLAEHLANVACVERHVETLTEEPHNETFAHTHTHTHCVNVWWPEKKNNT